MHLHTNCPSFRYWQVLLAAKRYTKSVGENLRRISMRKFQGQHVVDEKGKKTAVIIPVEEYEELLEDIHDLAIGAEGRDEPTMTFKLKEK